MTTIINKKKKILFIKLDLGNVPNGGVVAQKRNIMLYKHIYGETEVDEICIPKRHFTSLTKKILRVGERLIKANTWSFDKKLYNHIINIAPSYDIIHIDTSILGHLIKKIKNNGFQGHIVCFFHNIESCFNTSLIKKLGIFSWLYTNPIRRSEALTCKYADYIYILNERDNELLYKIYKRKADILLPITVEDRYKPYNSIKSNKIELLFVGSYFFANVSSLKWFDDEVAPYLDKNVKITIVGNGMSKIKSILKNEIYEIHDFVEDLGFYYQRASAVLLPIKEGGGMKIKTCEALMWGKYLIGTTEAFQGYPITEKQGCINDDKYAFINSIKKLSRDGIETYCEESRSLYLKNFTNDIMYNRIKLLLNNI